MVEFDIQQNTAKLEAGGNILTLNTTLLNQIPFKRSSLYQCIGELECVGVCCPLLGASRVDYDILPL